MRHYNKNKETQKRLKKIFYGQGRYYCVGVAYDDTKNRYYRYYLGDKFFKRYCHKQCRMMDKHYIDNEDYDMLTGGKDNIDTKRSEYWWRIS